MKYIVFIIALLTICSSALSQESYNIYDLDLENPDSIDSAAKFCADVIYGNDRFSEQGYEEHKDLCVKSFFCGEGGCEPIGIIVVIDSAREADFQNLLNSLPVDEMHLCSPTDEYENQFNSLQGIRSHVYTNAFADRMWSDQFLAYCGSARPGYEIDTIIQMRRHSDIVMLAAREGGEAGAPPAMIDISKDAFFRFRTHALAELRHELKSAIEVLTGKECQTNTVMTCSIILSRGRIKLDLLVPGSDITGRIDQWEKSYWEVYPHWTGWADEYQLYFDLPITAVRRWPVTGEKPSGGFQSLDYDQGFEEFRFAVMSLIANNIGATVSENFN